MRSVNIRTMLLNTCKKLILITSLLAGILLCNVHANAQIGIITTFAGNGSMGYAGDGSAAKAATLNEPICICVDASGNQYISDTRNNVVRKVSTTGIITTVAGNYTLGAGYSGDGGPATAAKLSGPWGVFCDAAGNLYIAEANNNV